MKTMSVADFKAEFSSVLAAVRQGEQIAIQYGRNKEIVAHLVPPSGKQKKGKRPLGLLQGKAKVRFAKDFKMTDDDLFKS